MDSLSWWFFSFVFGSFLILGGPGVGLGWVGLWRSGLWCCRNICIYEFVVDCKDVMGFCRFIYSSCGMYCSDYHCSQRREVHTPISRARGI
ncbi:hypothetical protein BO71DRAFT_112636 [Aspergillus ellipticus CBS 707.79]|uniref:Uncharacterized protein n=1 Tax=Aspergillus ellipticus CBS 707.79 TaxID=1448320 RepID=A0A319CX61_9EURO|nr:hypothetical protein BO71DRAFT_112636 [Aspergillus ellipticus CBS 707.79]